MDLEDKVLSCLLVVVLVMLFYIGALIHDFEVRKLYVEDRQVRAQVTVSEENRVLINMLLKMQEKQNEILLGGK